MDDLQCLRDYAANSNEDAFRKVVERHAGLVYSAARRQVYDHATAEEVSQAVFIALARKAGRFREGTVVAAWLVRAVRFAALHAMRDRARRPAEEPLTDLSGLQHVADPRAESSHGIPEVGAFLDEALAKLGQKDREALVLRYFEECTLSEVAAALRVTEDAATKRVSRAMDRLRRLLARKRVVLPIAVTATFLTSQRGEAASPELIRGILHATRPVSPTISPTVLSLAQHTMKTLAWHQRRSAVLFTLAALAAASWVPMTWSAPTPGSLDHGFIRTNAPGLVSALAIQPDGRILAISTAPGFISNGSMSESRRILLRLEPNGSTDTTFAPDSEMIPDAVAVQPDGGIVVAASLVQTATPRRISILRLLPNGNRDSTFEVGPGTEPDDYLPGAISVQMHGLAVEPDGRILVCGNFLTYAGQTHSGVVRLNSNGSVDSTFTAETRPGDQVSEPRYQSDGRLVVTAWSISNGSTPHPVFGSRAPRIIRLASDGTLDPTFRMTTGAGSLRLMAVQPDDRLICTGWIPDDEQTLTRLEAAGARDPSYAPTVRAPAGRTARIERVIVQPDGKAIVLGTFSHANGIPRSNIARYHADGTLDATFDPGDSLPNTDSTYFRALALDSDGGIVVGGSFRTPNDLKSVGIVRLLGDRTTPHLVLVRTGADVLLSWLGGDAGPFDLQISEDLNSWSSLLTLTNGVSTMPLRLPLNTDRLQAFRAQLRW